MTRIYTNLNRNFSNIKKIKIKNIFNDIYFMDKERVDSDQHLNLKPSARLMAVFRSL